MTNFEVQEILDSFQIIVDNREHKTPKAFERYKTFGVPYKFATLSYGDYCADAILPGGRHIVDTSKTINPVCVVERKMNLDELAGCFGNGRERFEREFLRGTAAGARMFLLVEGATWEAIYMHRYKSKMNVNSFISSISAWTVRYNMIPIFCKADTSGKVIREFLYRDLKERLQRGEYG